MSCPLCNDTQKVPIKINSQIDFFGLNRETGLAVIGDWKTSQRIPSRTELQHDIQLPIYAVALATQYPEIQTVTGFWYYITRSTRVDWRNAEGGTEITQDDMKRALRYMRNTARSILAAEYSLESPVVPTLSYSSAISFGTCPRQYAYSRLNSNTAPRKLNYELDWGNDAMRLGRAVHRFVAEYVRHLIQEGNGNVDEITTVALAETPLAPILQSRFYEIIEEFISGFNLADFQGMECGIEQPISFEIEVDCPCAKIPKSQQKLTLEEAYQARPGSACVSTYGICPFAHLCTPTQNAGILQVKTVEDAQKLLEEITQLKARVETLTQPLQEFCKMVNDVSIGTERGRLIAHWKEVEIYDIPIQLDIIRDVSEKFGIPPEKLITWNSNKKMQEIKEQLVADGIGTKTQRFIFKIEKWKNEDSE